MGKRKNIDFSFLKEDSMSKFHNKILEMKTDHDTILDAISAYCEQYDIDTEEIKDLISPALVQMIREEAIKRRMIKDDTISLPI